MTVRKEKRRKKKASGSSILKGAGVNEKQSKAKVSGFLFCTLILQIQPLNPKSSVALLRFRLGDYITYLV